MGNRQRQYETIEELPKGAMSIPFFCKQYNNGKGVTPAYIYKLQAKGEIKIVDFQGYNFVLPPENN